MEPIGSNITMDTNKVPNILISHFLLTLVVDTLYPHKLKHTLGTLMYNDAIKKEQKELTPDATAILIYYMAT